jgi:hypothetical protein
MIIKLVIDFGELVKVALTRKVGKGVGEWGNSMGALLGFLVFVCVWVYFCCSGRCLCQGLQGTGVVYSWYSRLVSRW